MRSLSAAARACDVRKKCAASDARSRHAKHVMQMSKARGGILYNRSLRAQRIRMNCVAIRLTLLMATNPCERVYRRNSCTRPNNSQTKNVVGKMYLFGSEETGRKTE